MKAKKKARKQSHANIDAEHNSEEDKKKTESMNKEDAVESIERGTNASKKRKEGSRMKRWSKRKKTDSDLKEEEHLKTFLMIVPDEEDTKMNSDIIKKDGILRAGYSIRTVRNHFERMMSLKLITVFASDGAYNLLRFIQKQIDEAESDDGVREGL
ncbi:hypothetical protein Tco_0786829 [Tanacetum coccineum]